MIILTSLLSCGQSDKEKLFIVKGSENIIKILKKSQYFIKDDNYKNFHALIHKPNYKFHFVGGGSRRAIAAIIDQNTTNLTLINNTFSFDQKLLLKQFDINPLMYPFAKSEIIFVVNKNNPVISLNLSQLQGILIGQIDNWKFEEKKEKIIIEKEEPKLKNQVTHREKFIETEKIMPVGRKKSSGNYFWVYKKVLQAKSFTSILKDFVNDSEIVNFIKNDQTGKYSIGYITKNNFNTSVTFDELKKLEEKLDKSELEVDELEKLLIGQDLKRLIIYDDINSTEGKAFKTFHIYITYYLVIPNVTNNLKLYIQNKDLEPLIDFFYSNEMKNLLLSKGLIPLPRPTKNIYIFNK